MLDYELFKEAGGEKSLSDDDWDKLIKMHPEHVLRYRQFKEFVFPHADICGRISAGWGKVELTPVKRKSRKPKKPTKRSSLPSDEAPQAKKACIETDGDWDSYKEKLLLFLCWRAKGGPGDFTNGWADVTAQLNEYCTTNFTLKEVEAKYVNLMQCYSQFKLATGYSSAGDAIPKTDMDWECLMRERPHYYQELEKLKDAGGFPHVEACSLIKGDTPSKGTIPANLSEYLATGALLIPQSSDNPKPSTGSSESDKAPIQPQSSGHSIASAQAPLSANELSYLLPAAASIVTAAILPGANGHQGSAGAQPVIPPPAAVPAVMTQELHDNLNMFLKTATAYLVMLINEHNQDKEM
ncbi:unnamed protein product [Phytophthora lilii]|uniref:Unnamed protein product n=1 Tax=Phytophthora lilii TaxID=2077276 RepID=A0A9W6TQ42_9STRA|nr:unnamed protein product [Phytophthora lilii]